MMSGNSKISTSRGSRMMSRLTAAFGGEKETSPAPAPETVRRIAQGEVIGLIAENGAHVWRGLPYAASTAGDNRWRAPQPAPAWERRRAALEFAERCAQLTNEFDQDEGLKPGLVIGSEDCLALDIYAPADAKGKALPVLVWIHGGGNVWGRSSSYDGSNLAANEDLIMVAIQYRVGPLGWFAHKALRASARTPEEACACFATLDLIASLRWVRDNIAAFGGDPDNVTIAGESSGGHNVVTLLASPLARGLFHRAIVQSGSFDSVSLAEAEGDQGELLNPSKRIADVLNAATAEALRALPVEKLLGAYTRGRGFVDVPRVIEDGVVLPAGPLRDAFATTETFNAVPIMLGTNRDEMKLFYLSDGKMTKKILGFFVVARDQDFYDAVAHYISRVWRIRSVDEPAALMTEAGHDAIYTYRFDWDDGGRFLFMDLKKLFGAAHGFEMPFVFGRFEHLGRADRLLFQKNTLSDREALSRAMGGFWASFARDGVPSYTGAPAWPVYRENGGSFMRLDTANDGGIEVVNAADSLDALVADMKMDPRIDDAKRCMIVEEMGNWMFARPIRAQVQAATGCE
jgi:para-nitrobenzyl esterase